MFTLLDVLNSCENRSFKTPLMLKEIDNDDFNQYYVLIKYIILNTNPQMACSFIHYKWM